MNAQEIINELDNIFNSDPLIDEFDIVVCNPYIGETTGSGSVVFVDHKVALVANCVKIIYKYAIESYHQLVRDESTNLSVDKLSNELLVKLLSFTRVILLIKGDYPMAFNTRKLLLSRNHLSVAEELMFLSVLYTKHPKSPSAWNHRRFCLLLDKDNNKLQEYMVINEMNICTRSISKHPKNYYAWMHRLWTLNHLTIDQLLEELTFIGDWLFDHPSDHSAVSHRHQVIALIIDHIQLVDTFDFTNRWSHDSINASNLFDNSSNAKLSLYSRLWRDSSYLVIKRPGSESVWYDRRSLISDTISLITNYNITIEDDIVITALDILSISESTALTESIDLTSLIDQLISVAKFRPLLSLVYLERQFVNEAIERSYSWNKDKQIRFARSYLQYLIYEVNRFIHSTNRLIER